MDWLGSQRQGRADHMTQEDQGKGRAGTKLQERMFEEELGSRQSKRKVGRGGGRKRECRRGVQGTKEAATDQFLPEATSFSLFLESAMELMWYVL